MHRQQTAYLDCLFPAGTSHVTPKELAAACGYTPQHIIACIDNGQLGAFQIPGKIKGGATKRLHSRIPAGIARAFLLSHSTSLDDALILDQFSRAATALPRTLKAAVWQEIGRQLGTAS